MEVADPQAPSPSPAAEAAAYDPPVLYGRDSEREAIGALLDLARASRSGVLVVRGEPGVGKTALLEDARDRAPDMQVLVARGIESEVELPFGAVHQLLRPAADLTGELPEPQARALRGAMGMGDGGGSERFLVYAAVLTLLSQLAERRPVLCLVDDAHWLDAASADALRFVARRLRDEGVVMLFGARDGDVRRFEADDLPTLVLGGLDAEAASALLADARLDVESHVRDRLVAHTRGNALALVQLPRMLTPGQRAGTEALPDSLPLTRRLEAAFGARVASLPEATRRLLVIVAADDSEDLGVVARAAGEMGLDVYALEDAERDDLVRVHGMHVAFRHPLVRSAVYGGAPAAERRAAHRALADALADDDREADRRAWHLASSSLGREREVVAELDHLAERADERGAGVTAARAHERAASLSPAGVERATRLVRAAVSLSGAGRDADAISVADRVDLAATDPVLRAGLSRVRASAAVRQGRPADGASALLRAAREVAGRDAALASELAFDALGAIWQGGGGPPVDEIVALAARLERAGGGGPDIHADTLAGVAAMLEGDPAAVRLLGRTVTWAETATAARHVNVASWVALWLGDMPRFEALLDRAADLARARGELGTLVDVLTVRSAHLALVGQRYREAHVAAHEAVELGSGLEVENLLLTAWATLAVVAAVHGDDATAVGLAERVIPAARANQVRIRASLAVAALAFVDMGRGRWNEAHERFASLTDPADPAIRVTSADAAEAAARAGNTVAAREALGVFEAWSRGPGGDALAARLAACRALVSPGPDAEALYRQAVDRLPAARPLDRPRVRLMYGEHLRRAGRRVEAREHLRAAVDGFDAIGAEAWAERARVELRATGETARRRDPSAASTLTPQERQVAGLVARGFTNREIAAHLFLSPRTVDAHLRGVFGKLGITSRRELRGASLDDLAMRDGDG